MLNNYLRFVVSSKDDNKEKIRYLENKIKEDMQHQLVKVDENGEINDI